MNEITTQQEFNQMVYNAQDYKAQFLMDMLAKHGTYNFYTKKAEYEICEMDCKSMVRHMRRNGYCIYWDKFYKGKYTSKHCLWLLYVLYHYHAFEDYPHIPVPKSNNFASDEIFWEWVETLANQ